jgi:hypothetical protein
MTVSDTGSSSKPDSSPQSWSSWAAQQEADAPLACGSVLRGRFVLEELIGSGGMGQVFRARDLRREEAQDRHPHVAIKVLAGEFKRHPDALKALQREARKAQKLAHPSIGSVYDFDRDGANVYLVMELLEGEPLNEVVKAHAGTGLGTERALQLVEEVGIALAHAHSRGIVHSDFKPSNVFLTGDGEAKVIDFGIARAARTGPKSEETSTAFDPAKLGAATLAYASPEQLLAAAEPDPRDDVYSLAVVAYELLAGRHPFGRRSALEAQLQEMTVAPIAGLSDAQNATLRCALSFNRERRPATVNDFVTGLGLQPVLRNIAISHVAPVAYDRTQTSVARAGARGRASAAAWAMGLAAIIVLGGGGFYTYTQWQATQERQRQVEEQQRRAAEERLARERRARDESERARQAAEERAAAESEARARVERERLQAEAQAERERLARERADRERKALQTAGRKPVAADPAQPMAGASASHPAEASAGGAPKPGTIYRWEDDAGEVHYGTVVPPQYAAKAVPVVP